jgi:predicted dehydrogenase
MSNQELKLGFIGSGFISHFLARALSQVRGATIASVYSPKNAQAFAGFAQKQNLGEARVERSIRELAEKVDTVVLAVPNFMRIEVMEEVVRARKAGAGVWSVICDKPLARNVAEARRMVELAKEGQLLTAYFENQIFMNSVQAQRKQLAPLEQAMGPLHLTRSAEEHGGPHMAWFWDPTRQGGGVLCDMGCHSIAVGWYMLTPSGKAPTFLQPEKVTCDLALLKWGLPKWRDQLVKTHKVDYWKTPAEDFATGTITFRNPDTDQRVKAQFTDSWMFEKQGLRLFMDGTGPGYAFEINTLTSPLNIFIGDVAAQSVADRETALEKATASRGLLAVQPNEADLYGYTDEFSDAIRSFRSQRDALLSFEYGYEISRLVMACYLAHERGITVDLTKPEIKKELDTYVPAIQRGQGAEVLGIKHR